MKAKKRRKNKFISSIHLPISPSQSPPTGDLAITRLLKKEINK